MVVAEINVYGSIAIPVVEAPLFLARIILHPLIRWPACGGKPSRLHNVAKCSGITTIFERLSIPEQC